MGIDLRSFYRTMDTVYHVGSFDISHRTAAGYEGKGLSVSVDPESWISIARLGGHPTWELHNPKGTFIDFHSLKNAPACKDVLAWNQKYGYLTPGLLYVFSYYDSETDGRVSQSFTEKREVDAEFAEAHEELEPEINAINTLLPTATMQQRGGQSSPPLHMIEDLAVCFYAESELPEVDGVWWDDDDDPGNYSAPRGVIFDDRLARWSRTLA